MASHYAQAFAQHYPQPGWPNTTPQGYTLSSTYTNQSTSGSVQASFQSRPSGQWYQPGSVRCSKPGCQFTGSQKAVETHMMDRHLIYPPGWEKRKKKPDWDADPSLKGKPILIQGTNIKLDTPEAIEAWMAERKKRFPTAQKVEEKQQKLDEAIARGQLSVDDPRFPKQKRRRVEHEGEYGGDRGRGRGKGRGRETVSLPAVQQHPPRKLPPKQPRRPPHNPFASRPSLLRNLLLPEIRMTVSNLSQAIHFLVSNDFLDNVELKPGQASDRKIEVISETVNAPDDTQS
ncbi:hypothetical protein K474DRAFT_1590598 [Panus rudis PR-1116 ss-1]|nr:hypothetical protein K474DRAFT_1590598 [Panus rudis PR-1116 ss-1]